MGPRTKRIVIIDGHPDPDESRYVHALANAYESGARSGGHDVVLLKIATLAFPLLRTREDIDAGVVPRSIESARRALIRCDHIVLLYPLWIGGMPALLKGFLEQIFRDSISYAWSHERAAARHVLEGKSVRIIITMRMAATMYRDHLGSPTVKGRRKREIGSFLGVSSIRTRVIGRVESIGAARRAAILSAMSALGRAGA
ncbi:MAG TPA: NAD(P)H-dependent oxidoreductase [Steroidobacteraceae bacterium]|nr:NAD(P)H-dependent oxidoreductase [Steroidobacteraceae bacterium]